MEKLFWSIFNADSDEALNEIVTTHPLLNDSQNWFPYGGSNVDDKSNFGTFENQQPDPIPALVEKLTNSIDSILMKNCRLKNIDPKSDSAPKSLSEAVEIYFGIKNGDFSEVSKDTRRDIAENIQVIATGSNKSPNIMVYDHGEGQHPDDFYKTFLSLMKNNKTDIPFVQGKYNMGSTGAVVFCGQNRYQLIASKLNNKLHNNGSKNEFGFTLVRRHPLTEIQEEQYGSSWYEYFIVDRKIPRFHIENLDLGLFKDKKFYSGSIVKLYSYQLPRGSRSDLTLDLWRDLNQFLYLPALPILLCEKRFSKGHSQSKLMLGNKTRIVIDERESKEKTISLKTITSEIGTINIEATVIKYGIKQKEFIKDKAIIFTLNGQVHGSLPRSYISQNLGLSMLRDSMLINVDCTKMKTSFRQDLFMANRTNLKKGNSLEILLDVVTDIVKSNDALKELNQNRKNRILHESAHDKDILKTLMESMPLDKNILNLLKKGGDLNFSTQLHGDHNDQQKKKSKKNEIKPYSSKRFPSIFKIDLKQDAEGKRVKSIPLNGKGIISFETDVEDEYLFRPKEKGELQINILGPGIGGGGGGTGPNKIEDTFDITVAGPTNNSIRIAFEPNQNVSIGDEVKINARLSSPEGNLECIFYVKIVDPVKKTKKTKNKPKDQPALPKPIRVFQQSDNRDDMTWEDYDMTGDDIVKVIPSDTANIVEAIAINMNSNAIKRFISKYQVKTESKLKLVNDKYFSNVYLHSLFLYGIFEKLNKTEEYENELDIEVLVPTIFKSYAPCLLYINSDELLF